MGIYEDMNRIYGSSIFDSAVRRKNTFDVKPFDLKVPFPNIVACTQPQMGPDIFISSSHGG